MAFVSGISMLMLIYVGYGEAHRNYQQFLIEKLAAQGKISAETQVWHEGMENWTAYGSLDEQTAVSQSDAAAAGADCFVTGEPRHSQYHLAREVGIHCVFGGHYVTETVGVRALGDWLAGRYDIEIVWIDHPTGV